MKKNLNLQKIMPGNIQTGLYTISCNVCGYKLTGNCVNDVVDRANHLQWKYDSENDRVICRYCRYKERKNVNKKTR